MSTKEEKLRVLYERVNEMMDKLGADGQINTRANEVLVVMDALYELDGGVYDTEKAFGGKEQD